MSRNILDEIKEKIIDADLVLVGIGEQLSVPTRMMEQEEKYKAILEKNLNAEYFPYLQQIYIQEKEKEYIDFYNRLFDLIKEKNYYVLTTNADDVIYKSNIANERVVSPCGSIHQFVCSKCKGEIENLEEKYISENRNIFTEENIEKLNVKVCPVCGKMMQPNIVTYEYYDEKGYLDKWERYTKWLQGTVNRKLCILELGVGLAYPTVIRWPNEKIVTYNNKAYMFRIHNKLFQLSEGIGERAKSVAENPMNII